MNANAYDLLALCMRYVFAAVMVLILLRAWKITAVDWQRSHRLRRLSPETGIVGEFLVVDGHERSRDGMRYPVTLEGTIGSGRGCDIRLRSNSLRKRHAIFQMTEDGLFIRGHAGGRLRDGFGRPAKELTLHDGDYITIGSVRLMLILSDTENPREARAERVRGREHGRAYDQPLPRPTIEPGISRSGDDLFEVSSETRVPRPPRRDPIDHFDPLDDNTDDEDDVFYDYDEYDDC